MMIRIAFIAVCLALCTGCKTEPRRLSLQWPDLQDVRARLPELRVGMSNQESIAALGLNECPWQIWSSTGDHRQFSKIISLGPKPFPEPTEYELELHFRYSHGGTRARLESWQIRKSEEAL